MIQIRIHSVGKTKEAWLEQALHEYLQRLTKVARITFIFAKNDEALLLNLDKERLVIGLDPLGSQYDSVAFSRFLEKEIEKSGGRVAFVIGGAEGLPRALKSKIPLVSLSQMTFTHQVTRLILVEQLYRAFSLLQGLPYHK